MNGRIAQYWDGRAKAYDKNVRPVIYSRRDMAAWQNIFAGAIGERCQKILDVGTGPGIVANLLADLGHEVTGIDTSVEMLNRARENTQALNRHLKFIQADVEDLPFEDSSFDAVVSRYVMWTIPNPTAALEEWHRVLKPGGRLVIVDGKWDQGRDRTLVGRLWKCLSLALVILTEHRVPCYKDLEKGLKNNLWSSHARRPRADVEMLESLGFRHIHIDEDLDKRLMLTLDYLKYGYCGLQFMVVGVK